MTRDHSSRTLSLADDERARVPFALVGVLLLVSSSAIAVHLQTRPDPAANVDVGLAVDQTMATSQSSVRAGVSTALDEAAIEPLTRTANTPAGRAIANTPTEISGPDVRAGTYENFGPYVRLRVYLAVQDTLVNTGQSLSDGVTTTASLPAVEYDQSSLEQAIDRVHIDVGRHTDDLQTGNVRATVENVTVTVRKDGELVATRERDLTVTVASTVFELHERTDLYEQRLQMGFFESGSEYKGFGKRFAARMYPLTYAKAYYERYRGKPGVSKRGSAAFNKIVSTGDARVFANDAIYATQRNVFGVDDPEKEAAMRSGWACMGTRLAAKVSSGSRSEKAKKADAVCSLLQFLATTNLDEEPPAGVDQAISANLNTAGNPDGSEPDQAANGTPLEQTVEVPIAVFSEPAYREVLGLSTPSVSEIKPLEINQSQEEAAKDSAADAIDRREETRDIDVEEPSFETQSSDIGEIIDQVYRVDVSATQTGVSQRGSLPDAVAPEDEHDDWSRTGGVDYDVTNLATDVDHKRLPDGDGRTATLHTYDVTVRNEYVAEQDWEREYEVCEIVTPAPTNETNSTQTNSTETPYEECHTETESTTTSNTDQITFSTTVEVTGTHSISSDVAPYEGSVENRGIENRWRTSGSPETPTYARAVDLSVEELFEGDPENLTDNIDATSISDAGDLRRKVGENVDDSATFGSDDLIVDNAEVREWVLGDLERTKNSFSEGTLIKPTKIKRIALANSERPFQRITDKLNNSRQSIVYTNGNYRTPAHKARAQLRKEYVDAIYRWIERVREQRNQGREAVNQDISDTTAGGADAFGESLEFFQDGVSADPLGDENSTLPASENLGAVNFTVDASPTYLTYRPQTRRGVPASRPRHYGPESPANTQHTSLAARSQSYLPNPGVPLVPWPSYWYLSANNWQVNVTGEYARFQVSATTGGPSSTKTTYVRQAQPITLDIADQQRRVGRIENIGFTSETNVAVVTPGFTLSPKGSWGTGNRLDTTAADPTSTLTTCSPNWNHTGPGFDQGDVAYSTCPSLTRGGGSDSGLSTSIDLIDDYREGDYADLVSDAGMAAADAADDREDDDDDGNPIDNDCEEETVAQEIDYYDDKEDVPGDVVDHYCNLAPGEERELFTHILDEEGTEATQTWLEMVDKLGPDRTRATIQRLLRDGWDADSTPLAYEHDIQRFLTGYTANQQDVTSDPDPSYPPIDGEPHREPGIVTELETEDEIPLARVYQSDGSISGGYLAWPTDVAGKDRLSLINDFALWDESVIREDAGRNAWGQYDCVGMAYVPEGSKLSVDKTSQFDGDFIVSSGEVGGALTGNTVQFEVWHHGGGSTKIPRENWIPFGTIANTTESGTFEEKWVQAQSQWDEDDDRLVNLADDRCGEGVRRGSS